MCCIAWGKNQQFNRIAYSQGFGFFHSQELQVLRDYQENLEKEENMEFRDPQDCKGYLDPKAEKVNTIYSAILVAM